MWWNLSRKRKKQYHVFKDRVSSNEHRETTPKPTVTRTAVAAGSIVINSPLPGVILDLRVKVGDTVKKGDTLLILEAMKMENNIQAPSDGKVAKVSINKGFST